MKTARAVIGASFGDEGKGIVTDYLCSFGAGIVVRFNSGAQAGHTVVTPQGDRHVFHHFGSGSMLDVPTFLSNFFICNPILFFPELKMLEAQGLSPRVYAHPDCLVTTFADMLINQHREDNRKTGRHGSCGIGFHETINRSKLPHLKITMADLWNGGERLPEQLEEICDKYARFRTGHAIGDSIDEDDAIEAFIKYCNMFADYVNPLGMGQCKDIVFEGAQGLLLDQDNKEFFPHVTHSKTGMRNVRILCEQAGIDNVEAYYVSRTYLTRHGFGPLPAENPRMFFEDDTNHENPYQGELRFAPLHTDNLLRRIKKDFEVCMDSEDRLNLVLTHCDQLDPPTVADLYFYGKTRNDATTWKPAISN